MRRYEIEAISRQWHGGFITAKEMREKIKGLPAGIEFCKAFDHERWVAGIILRPYCSKQL